MRSRYNELTSNSTNASLTHKPHIRNNRYFMISGQWYFSTRENLQIGPFSSFDEAEIELGYFLNHPGPTLVLNRVNSPLSGHW